MMEITSLCGVITKSQLTELERKIGATLPSDYQEFLLTNNAAKVQPNVFLIVGEQEENVVRYFMGICPDTKWYDLNYTQSMYEGRVLPTFFPIAIDEDSSVICVSLKAEDYGKIYFWDRHYENMDEPDESNMFWLADNFTDFLNKLY